MICAREKGLLILLKNVVLSGRNILSFGHSSATRRQGTSLSGYAQTMTKNSILVCSPFAAYCLLQLENAEAPAGRKSHVINVEFSLSTAALSLDMAPSMKRVTGLVILQRWSLLETSVVVSPKMTHVTGVASFHQPELPCFVLSPPSGMSVEHS